MKNCEVSYKELELKTKAYNYFFERRVEMQKEYPFLIEEEEKYLSSEDKAEHMLIEMAYNAIENYLEEADYYLDLMRSNTSPELYEMLCMYYLDGQSYNDIAEAYELSVSGIQMKIKRKLKEIFNIVEYDQKKELSDEDFKVIKQCMKSYKKILNKFDKARLEVTNLEYILNGVGGVSFDRTPSGGTPDYEASDLNRLRNFEKKQDLVDQAARYEGLSVWLKDLYEESCEPVANHYSLVIFPQIMISMDIKEKKKFCQEIHVKRADTYDVYLRNLIEEYITPEKIDLLHSVVSCLSEEDKTYFGLDRVA